VLLCVGVAVIAATAAFLLLHVAPGDPYSNLDMGGKTPPAVIAMQRAQRGLDRPLAEQYVRWLGSAARGDFGWSVSKQRPVADVLRDAVPRTLGLMGLSFVLSIALGVLLGAWQGTHAGTRGDRVSAFLALVAYSIPEFWLAMLLLWWLVPLLPASGITDDNASYYGLLWRLRDRAAHLVLPLLSLTLVGTAVIARFQRVAMREVFAELFVRTARAKGLDEGAVRRQALRAALLPVITISGLYFQSVFAGSVFVEKIFAWPGMGLTLLEGIGQRDYNLVAAYVIVGSGMAALGNLAADVLREVADPRLRRA
jgi:peptide/nickel transport system permease protein